MNKNRKYSTEPNDDYSSIIIHRHHDPKFTAEVSKQPNSRKFDLKNIRWENGEPDLHWNEMHELRSNAMMHVRQLILHRFWWGVEIN